MRDRELVAVGKVIQQQTGLAHRPLRDGERATGIYRRSVQLASGRFAMLDDGMGFSLVPWPLSSTSENCYKRGDYPGIGHRARGIGHLGTGTAAWAVGVNF